MYNHNVYTIQYYQLIYTDHTAIESLVEILFLAVSYVMYGCLQDLLFVLLLSCAFGAAAVLGGLSNTEWDDKYVQNPAYQEYEDVLVATKKSTVATTVSVKYIQSCTLLVIYV